MTLVERLRNINHSRSQILARSYMVEAADRIEALERDLARTTKGTVDGILQWADHLVEIERLEKALETAREALEPFGPLARVILSEAPPEATYTSLFLDCQGISHRITLDALRDVQRTLSQKKEG